MTHWDKSIIIGGDGLYDSVCVMLKTWIFFSWSQHLKALVFKDTVQMTFAFPQLAQGRHPPSFLELNWHCNHRKLSFQRWMGSSLARRISLIHVTYNKAKLVSQLQFCEEWMPIVLFSNHSAGLDSTQLKILLPQLPMGITPRVLGLLGKCSASELASTL